MNTETSRSYISLAAIYRRPKYYYVFRSIITYSIERPFESSFQADEFGPRLNDSSPIMSLSRHDVHRKPSKGEIRYRPCAYKATFLTTPCIVLVTNMSIEAVGCVRADEKILAVTRVNVSCCFTACRKNPVSGPRAHGLHLVRHHIHFFFKRRQHENPYRNDNAYCRGRSCR